MVYWRVNEANDVGAINFGPFSQLPWYSIYNVSQGLFGKAVIFWWRTTNVPLVGATKCKWVIQMDPMFDPTPHLTGQGDLLPD